MSLRGELWHHCKASILQYTHTYTHVHIHHLFIKTVVPPPPCRTSSRQSAESEEGSFTRAFKRRRQSTVLTMMQQLDAVTEEGRVEVCTWMDRVGGGSEEMPKYGLMRLVWNLVWGVFVFFNVENGLRTIKKKKKKERYFYSTGGRGRGQQVK